MKIFDDQVDFVLKHYKDISPFLRRCTILQLGPDFFIPQDMTDYDTANETPHSTIVDNDEPWDSSGSSGSENMMIMSTTNNFPCTEFVRKKRSELYVCGRVTLNSYKNEDMATSMNRRKGIPHRSPLCQNNLIELFHIFL